MSDDGDDSVSDRGQDPPRVLQGSDVQLDMSDGAGYKGNGTPMSAASQAAQAAPCCCPIVDGCRPMEPPLHRRDAGGLLSQDTRSLYFFGVIDILTRYDTREVIE